MLFTRFRRIPLVMVGVLSCSGCEKGPSNAWWNAFLDPTALGNYRSNEVTDIQRSISFRDTPVGIVGAEDPKPGDLVADVREYEIGPQDTLQIRMLDFVQLGAESELTPTVDDLGEIDLPQIGTIRASGRTARQLKSDIIQKAKAMGIYRTEEEPTVTVNVANQMQRRIVPLCDASQSLVEHPGERQQIVALFLQRIKNRTNARRVQVLSTPEFGDDEIE